jgi:hypothetical protein
VLAFLPFSTSTTFFLSLLWMDGWNLLSSASLEAEVTANIFYFAEGPMLVGNIKLFVFFFFFSFSTAANKVDCCTIAFSWEIKYLKQITFFLMCQFEY